MDGSHNDVIPPDALPSLSSTKPPTTLSRRKHKRSSAGKGDCCRTCRLRKVRCAGNPGGGEACTNCVRLRLDCSFKDAADPADALNNISRTTPSQEITEAGTVRKRAQRACAACHALKVRCSGELPRCQRCVDGELVCEYTKARRRKLAALSTSEDSGSKTSTPAGPDQTDQTKDSGAQESTMTVGVPGQVLGTIKASGEKRDPCFVDIETLSRGQSLALKDILKQHFDAYMEHLFYLPCLGFLHPASTLQAIEDGTLPAPRAAALCAAASPFLNPARDNSDFGARCIDQVELQIWRTMHTFSEEVLVLLALGMVYDFFSGSFAKPWQSMGVGVRLMQGLQLNWDVSQACVSAAKGGKGPTKSFLEQENMRRVAWHLFTFDRVLAGGYDEYITCQRSFMKIRLPCDDQSYLDARAVEAPRLDDMTSKMRSMTGLSGFGIRIMDLRHQIQAYTRTLASQLSRPQSKREPSSLMSGINGFQNALSQLHASLPLHLRLSEQTIAAHMSRPQRSGYIHFHTHFLVSHIDLYRFALPGFHQKSHHDALMKLPRDFIAKSQRQAISHAICLAKFCEDILKESKASAQRNGSTTTSTSDALKMAGDPTIAHMATQGLRVLLVALQHRLYEGLDLAEHSTVPIWRHETTDWPRIRSLIDSLIKISEPWAEVLVIARHAHASNVAMVEQFDKTNKFTDQPETINHSAAVLGPSKLPGSHYFLDSMHIGAHAEERRARAHDAAAQSWWTKTGRPASNGDSAVQYQADPASASLPSDLNSWSMPTDSLMMEAYGPPGIPIALARARGINFGMSDPNMYTVDDSLQAMQEMMWPMPDMNAMIVDPLQQPSLAADTGLPFLTPQQGQMGEMLPTTWTSMAPGIPAFFPAPTTNEGDGVYATNQNFPQQQPSNDHYML